MSDPAAETVASPPPSPAGNDQPSLIGKEIGGYRIRAELGRGAMGVVYRAEQPSLGREVALKLLISGIVDDVGRFEREARAAAKLSHPNIVQVYDVGQVERTHFIAMELVEGTTLGDLIRRRTLTPKACVAHMETIARALDHAHTQGVIHRDLKPANIMLDRDGRPKITDFGMAKEIGVGQGLTQSGLFLGTPEYASPEQAEYRSRDVDARSDVFSLGTILYEMLTGLLPFLGGGDFASLVRRVIEEDPIPPRNIERSIPRDAEIICFKCLEKEPDRRYQTAGNLADDCRRFLAGEPIAARPASAFYRMRKRLAKHGSIVAISVVAVVAVGALAVAKGVVVGTALAGAALVGLGAWSYARIMRERNEARMARDEANVARLSEAVQRRRAEAALAVERQFRRVEKELSNAQQVQANLLPPRIPKLPGLDMFPHYMSAREVGGDYYDFVPVDRTHLGLVVASVSSIGIAGAMVMYGVRSIFRMMAPDNLSASDVLKKVNYWVAKDIKRGFFVTAFYVILDVETREISVSSAGHSPGLLFRAKTGTVEAFNPGGIALGLDAGPNFDKTCEEQRLRLEPGDRMLLYTAGVTNAMNHEKDTFSSERLVQYVRDHGDLSSKDFVRGLQQELHDHRGDAEWEADMTILALRVLTQ